MASDDVEKAPSIGPRMAERLYAQGVKTVADLFAADPEKLSLALDQRNVHDETIVDWQDQARLVCTVPGLRGTHAQLLVGAGYRSRDRLAAAAEDKLCADILSFAVSPEGQRILRDGNPPDIERIKAWLANAIAARVA
jgi:antitoxin component HigA of HigAB toxin-antitoxin module